MGKRVYIVTDRLGSGDDELGSILMKNFMYALARNADKPVAVMMTNGGVKLACEGSECLDDLRTLEAAGVQIRACGTCLDFYGLAEKLAVGEVGNMTHGVSALLGGDDIVTIA